MTESILGITSKLTAVAELILDVEPEGLSAAEAALLRDRLPQWALTAAAIQSSVRALEGALAERNDD